MKRVKGFKLQEESRKINGLLCVLVSRPSKWGNPYKIGNIVEISSNTPIKRIQLTSAEAVVSMFEEYLGYEEMIESNLWKSMKKELKGKNLACWCPLDQPCHADVLLKIANQK